MPKESGANYTLPGLGDLFSTKESREDDLREKIYEISMDEIDFTPDQPFKVRMNAEMNQLVESIRNYGILDLGIVRKNDEGRYVLVSGNRRKTAGMIAGLETMPVIIRDMTRDEAIIYNVDTNLQRETILPSEKAFAYKMRLDAMKRQAGRPKNNSATLLQNYDGKTSRELLAEKSGESHEQIRKYIRLTELIPEILQMVDDGLIKMRPAVELSYLTKEEQNVLYVNMKQEDCTPSHAQAKKMRGFSESGNLTAQVISSIMQEEKPNQVEKINLPSNRISKYFKSGTPAKTIEDTIIKALDFYQKRQRDKEAR